MNTAHTPGPWSVGAPTGLVNQISIQPCIGVVYGAGDEIKANAALIAAAPDMYAVLRELAECSQYWSDYDVPLGIHDRIMAALAKAGRQ